MTQKMIKEISLSKKSEWYKSFSLITIFGREAPLAEISIRCLGWIDIRGTRMREVTCFVVQWKRTLKPQIRKQITNDKKWIKWSKLLHDFLSFSSANQSFRFLDRGTFFMFFGRVFRTKLRMWRPQLNFCVGKGVPPKWPKVIDQTEPVQTFDRYLVA